MTICKMARKRSWHSDQTTEKLSFGYLSPIQNIYTGSGAQPASCSIVGPLPVKKALEASNFLFPPRDATLRIGGALHRLLHILHGVHRGNFTGYVADLICLTETHRRTTSFP